MPIYEYVCVGCGHEFEELVLGAARPACPQCGDERPEKRFSSFATRSTQPPPAGPGPCGTCGDARGPGACSLD